MTRLKIISNPYKKMVTFQQWDDSKESWMDIDLDGHKASKLLSKEIKEGFFPFKAKKIVSQILEDYQIDGDSIELYFEGSADEFNELVSVCNLSEFENKVTPVCGNV